MTWHGPRFVRLRRAASERGEGGFSLLEGVVAIGLFGTVILGLLGALTTGVKGVVTGRQRTGATAIANQVIEQARALRYDQVGHDTSTPDATLNTTSDPALTSGCSGIPAPTLCYGGEALASSSVVGANSYFSPHRQTGIVKDGTTYTVATYVTQHNISCSNCNATSSKKVTAVVSWAGGQYGTAVATKVTVSTLLFNAGVPPDPHLTGLTDSQAGHVTVSGSINGVSVSADVVFGSEHGDLDSSFVKTVKGAAQSATAQVGSSSSISAINAATLVDNDAGTAPPENEQSGPVVAPAGSATAGGLTASLNTSTLTSQSTARCCDASAFSPVPTAWTTPYDKLAHTINDTTGPSTASVGWNTGLVSGSIVSMTSAADANGVIDRIATSANPPQQQVKATAKTSTAAVDLGNVTAGPVGFSGFVKIPATSVQAIANAGVGSVSNPSVTASPSSIPIQVWNGLGYTTVNVPFGTASIQYFNPLTVLSGLTGVQMDATITTSPVSTSTSSSSDCDTLQIADAGSWLTVQIHLVVPSQADLTFSLDYGKAHAEACYKATPSS